MNERKPRRLDPGNPDDMRALDREIARAERGGRLITPRTLRTAGGGLIVGGAVFVFAPWHPLVGAIMCAAGIAALWRADQARRDLIWHEWNDDRGEDPDADESAHQPPGDHLRNGPD